MKKIIILLTFGSLASAMEPALKVQKVSNMPPAMPLASELRENNKNLFSASSLLETLGKAFTKDMRQELALYLISGPGLGTFISNGLCIPHRILQGHGNGVLRARFNTAGNRVVTASDDNTAKIWDVETGQCLHTLQHENTVWSAKFNTAGDRVVTASRDGTVKIWDVEIGQCLHTLQGHRGIVESAQFNGVGDRVVTASRDRTAKIWDVETGQCLHTLEHERWLNSAQFNGAGDKIVTASNDSTAKIWDVETGQCLHTLQGHTNAVGSARFNTTGDKIVTASRDRTARIWDVETGQCLHTLQDRDSVKSAQFNGAGDKIVTVSDDYTARIWDIDFVERTCNRLFKRGFLEKSRITLKQAFLLQAIYQVIILRKLIALRVQKEMPALTTQDGKALSAKELVLDFDTYAHLEGGYEALPAYIQKIFNPYVRRTEPGNRMPSLPLLMVE